MKKYSENLLVPAETLLVLQPEKQFTWCQDDWNLRKDN